MVLSDISNATSDQDKSNKIHDYIAQTEGVLGDLEAQSLINQSVIYKYKNSSREGLCLGDAMLMEAEYVRAKSMHTQLYLDKLKATELLVYLNNSVLGLPKPKLFIEQLVLALEKKC